MGEFAGVLPDYHKPDIMTLITSYMDPAGGGAGGGASRREEMGGMKRQKFSSGKYVESPQFVLHVYLMRLLLPRMPTSLLDLV